MKRIMTSMAAALAAAGCFKSLPSGPNYRTKHDPERVRNAALKRARKNAKRLGLVTLSASDATTTVELPK